jgi:predicted ATP-dependent Lon-type protease
MSNINTDIFKENDFHIHMESGAVYKDGPSAGIALITSIISLIKKKSIDSSISMTGEITLRGKILPVGGIKEKIITSKELINLLGQYKIDVKQASLLLARILFPTTIFDLLEEHYLYRNDVKNKIMRYYHDLKEYIKEIKYIEKELVRRYGIRPITWLEK